MPRVKLSLLDLLLDHMTTHTCPDGALIASIALPDGRVLRVVGHRDKVPHPCGELFKTLALERLQYR
jgi:hypothetical protein